MRLATFNILSGRALSDDQVNVDRFAEAVRSLDADVLGLQEVDRNQPRSHGHDLTAIAADAMGAIEHRFVAAVAGTPGETWRAATGAEEPGTAGYGVALLSRLPVQSWEVIRLPALPLRVPHRWADQRRPVLVRDEPRVAVAALVASPNGTVTVVNTHLSFIDGWNVVQLRQLRRNLTRHRGPLVLMGDLNMGTAWATRATGLSSMATALTFPSNRPERQIDHVLSRKLPLVAQASAAHELAMSDHRALTVDL